MDGLISSQFRGAKSLAEHILIGQRSTARYYGNAMRPSGFEVSDFTKGLVMGSLNTIGCFVEGPLEWDLKMSCENEARFLMGDYCRRLA